MKYLFPFFVILGLTLSLSGAERPNVLIIIADDCTYNDLPLYGGENAKTPHIDKLAREGLTFNQAYLSEAMCQPCRSELYSGQHPMRNGAAWNHSGSRPETKSLPHYLGDLNYRVGLSGKVHVTPQPSFPFEKVDGFDPNCVRDPTLAHEVNSMRNFMTRNEEEPFCLVVALVEPHVPWVMGDRSQYPDDKIKLPPNLVDTSVTRDAFARYLAEITYMDDQVGRNTGCAGANRKGGGYLGFIYVRTGCPIPWMQMDQLGYWPAHSFGCTVAGENQSRRAY